MALHLFAGLRVRELQAVRPWYERLLGEPTFLPHATEAVWTLAEDRSVYVLEQADGAGNSVVTIFLDDLDAHVAAAAARGLEPDERLTYSNVRSGSATPTDACSQHNRASRRGGQLVIDELTAQDARGLPNCISTKPLSRTPATLRSPPDRTLSRQFHAGSLYSLLLLLRRCPGSEDVTLWTGSGRRSNSERRRARRARGRVPQSIWARHG
jgi:hypothetical protein